MSAADARWIRRIRRLSTSIVPHLLAWFRNDFFASVNYVTHLDQFFELFKIRWAVHQGNIGLKVLVPPQNYAKAQDSGYLRSRRRIE